MSFRLRISNGLLWGVLSILCKLDLEDLKKIPSEGPFIIAVNHINFLEVPLIQLAFRPRNVRGIVKKETGDKVFLRYYMNLWKAIPLDRKGNPEGVFHEAGRFFAEKGILIIAPEGTRSGDGILRKAHGGVILMAHRYDVPILPVVHYGGERFWLNLKRFKRTAVTFRVGEMIHLEKRDHLSKSERVEALNTLMGAMAKCLPEKYRGYYGAN